MLLWLHCLNLISTAPENALRLKNSKLSQNNSVLRIIDSVFVQTVSFCCLDLLFSLIIHVVLHVRKNINAALAVTSHSQLLSFSPVLRPYRPVLHVKSGKLRQMLNQELGVVLLWLHCLNLISTAPKNVLTLKSSKLSQNNDVLRIIDSTFVQLHDASVTRPRPWARIASLFII